MRCAPQCAHGLRTKGAPENRDHALYCSRPGSAGDHGFLKINDLSIRAALFYLSIHIIFLSSPQQLPRTTFLPGGSSFVPSISAGASLFDSSYSLEDAPPPTTRRLTGNLLFPMPDTRSSGSHGDEWRSHLPTPRSSFPTSKVGARAYKPLLTRLRGWVHSTW